MLFGSWLSAVQTVNGGMGGIRGLFEGICQERLKNEDCDNLCQGSFLLN
jgi:hypothetical protein